MKAIRKIFVFAWIPIMTCSILGILGSINVFSNGAIFFGIFINIFAFLFLFWLVGITDCDLKNCKNCKCKKD